MSEHYEFCDGCTSLQVRPLSGNARRFFCNWSLDYLESDKGHAKATARCKGISAKRDPKRGLK